LYFLGLSFRNTAKATEPFVEGGSRSHVASHMVLGTQQFNPKHICILVKGRVSAFLVDESQIQIGGGYPARLWIATIEPVHTQGGVLGVSIYQDTGICLWPNHFFYVIG
jgi:hypothetical protein